MKLLLWIALALTATLTLTAFAEVIIPAEDALIIEDALTDGEAELAVDEAIELLPGDIALEEEIADMPPATDAEAVANGVEANTEHLVSSWSELVDALKSAKNGDTIIIGSSSIRFEGYNYAKISGKTVTLDLGANRIMGKKDTTPIFYIENNGELVLKGYSVDKELGITRDNRAVHICGDGRFTMESGTIKENNQGVYNDGIFNMKKGLITKNDVGVYNSCYGTLIVGITPFRSEIIGNKYGVLSYNSSTAITVSGRVNITGNTNADVLLMKGQIVAVSGPLDQYSLIGITLSDTNLPGPGKPVVVTKGLKGNGTAENFKVWGDYKAEINADGELEVSLKEAPFTLPAAPDATLLAKLTASGKRALHLTWTAVDGAQGYDVYFGRCGEKLTKVATVTDDLSCKLKGLKKGKTYRAFVKAWTRAGGTKEYIGESSPKVYAIVGGYNNSRCNPKAVSVDKTRLSLKVGKSARISAKVKGVKASRKVLKKTNLLRYYSTDRNVAMVNSGGKVTAVGAGKCKVWVVANNGVRKGVKVVVK